MQTFGHRGVPYTSALLSESCLQYRNDEECSSYVCPKNKVLSVAFSNQIQPSNLLKTIRIQRISDFEILLLNILRSIFLAFTKILKLFQKGLQLSLSKSSLKFPPFPHLYARFLRMLSCESMDAPLNEFPAPADNYYSQFKPPMVRVRREGKVKKFVSLY